MKEVGEVIKVKKNFATVSVKKKDECSKCGMCLFSQGADSTEFNAENHLNAVVGDKVVIETSEKTRLIGVLLVFLVPLLLIGLTIGANYLFIFSDIWTAGISVFLVVLWYTILALIDKRLAKRMKYATQIIEIVKENEENE